MRPAPLQDEAAGTAVVVKNTFLEEVASVVSAGGGLSTAPASCVGVLKRSLAEAASTSLSSPPMEASSNPKTGEADGGESATTASTPTATAGNEWLWPPTPATPTAPVRISLVELMGGAAIGEDEACVGTADGATGAGVAQGPSAPFDSQPTAFGPQAVSAAEQQMLQHYAQHGLMQVPCWEMPAMTGPACWEYTAPPYSAVPSAAADAGVESQIFACVANAPAPKCAPPCAPAPPCAAVELRPASEEAEPPCFDAGEAPARS